MSKKCTHLRRALYARRLSLLPALFLLASVAVSARADVYLVSAASTAANPDGFTWATAFKTVTAGLAECIAGDEAWVAAGTYTGRVTMKKGVSLYGGFTGTETTRDQRNPTAHETIISSDGTGTVVTIPTAAGAETVLDGFTIKNGNNGVDCGGSSATISHNIISHNSATGWNGAGIYMVGGSPTITNNTITGNSAPRHCDSWGNCGGGYGGGLYIVNATPVLSDNVISQNSATHGGGAYVTDSTILITGNSLTGNSADSGGGLHIVRGSVAVRQNAFSGNVTGGYGAGIFAEGGSPEISDNVFSGNTAPRNCDSWGNCGAGSGGALCASGSSPQFYDNTVTGNSAYIGAGLFLDSPSPMIAHNTFANNSAANVGGAIFSANTVNGLLTRNSLSGNNAGDAYIQGQWTLTGNAVFSNTSGGIVLNAATASLFDNTVAANTNADGIIAQGSSTVTMVNNIVAYNTSGIQQQAGSTITMRNNCVAGNTTYDYSGLADQTGLNGNILANPRFANRPGGDFHLLGTSTCIDVGDDSIVVACQRDLDGRPRIIGAHVDMGAYENGTVGARTLSDVADAVRLYAGLKAADFDSLARLNIDRGGATANKVDWYDIVWLARIVAGLEPVY